MRTLRTLKRWFSLFQYPHIAVIAIVATFVAMGISFFEGGSELDKAAFQFSSAICLGFLTAAAVAIKRGAKNTSVLLCVLAFCIISSVLVGTDDTTLGTLNPLEGLMSGAGGATIALIMMALQDHMNAGD